MPTRSQRTGFGFAIADDRRDDDIGIIKRGSVRVTKGITEFATLMNGAGRFRRDVTWNAARKRELLEEFVHALLVLGNVRVSLAISAFEPGVRHDAWSSMPGADDVD